MFHLIWITKVEVAGGFYLPTHEEFKNQEDLDSRIKVLVKTKPTLEYFVVKGKLLSSPSGK